MKILSLIAMTLIAQSVTAESEFFYNEYQYTEPLSFDQEPVKTLQQNYAIAGPDLWFVKTNKTISGFVEVYSATPSSRYGSGTSFVTSFNQNLTDDGVFQVNGGQLWYIKLRNTNSGRIEVYSSSIASGFKAVQGWATYFPESEALNGKFQIFASELWFVKLRNTDTGMIEMHSAKASDNYLNFNSGIHRPTHFGLELADKGEWRVNGRDLWLIQFHNTPSGKVEIHSANCGSIDCSRFSDQNFGEHEVTYFDPVDEDNGFWNVSTDTTRNHYLTFIKTKNAQSGQVEAHLASKDKGYTNFNDNHHIRTYFPALDGENGLWFTDF